MPTSGLVATERRKKRRKRFGAEVMRQPWSKEALKIVKTRELVGGNTKRPTTQATKGAHLHGGRQKGSAEGKFKPQAAYPEQKKRFGEPHGKKGHLITGYLRV